MTEMRNISGKLKLILYCADSNINCTGFGSNEIKGMRKMKEMIN